MEQLKLPGIMSWYVNFNTNTESKQFGYGPDTGGVDETEIP